MMMVMLIVMVFLIICQYAHHNRVTLLVVILLMIKLNSLIVNQYFKEKPTFLPHIIELSMRHHFSSFSQAITILDRIEFSHI